MRRPQPQVAPPAPPAPRCGPSRSGAVPPDRCSGWRSAPCSPSRWSAGPGPIEPAVALTIAYVGLENALLAAPRRREVVTFAFGLVHGFGFAHILREVGLPRRHLAVSLLCFNLGVEVGQVVIVTLLFPVVHLLARGAPSLATSGLLLALLGLFLGALHLAGVSVGWGVLAYPALLALCILLVRRHGYRTVVLKGGSTAIAAFGLFWLVERLWGRQLLGGYLG